MLIQNWYALGKGLTKLLVDIDSFMSHAIDKPSDCDDGRQRISFYRYVGQVVDTLDSLTQSFLPKSVDSGNGLRPCTWDEVQPYFESLCRLIDVSTAHSDYEPPEATFIAQWLRNLKQIESDVIRSVEDTNDEPSKLDIVREYLAWHHEGEQGVRHALNYASDELGEPLAEFVLRSRKPLTLGDLYRSRMGSGGRRAFDGSPRSITAARKQFLDLCDEAERCYAEASSLGDRIHEIQQLAPKFQRLENVLGDPSHHRSALPPIRILQKTRAKGSIFIPPKAAVTEFLVLIAATDVHPPLQTHSEAWLPLRWSSWFHVLPQGGIAIYEWSTEHCPLDDAGNRYRTAIEFWKRFWRRDAEWQSELPLEWLHIHAQRLNNRVQWLRNEYKVGEQLINGESYKVLPRWDDVALGIVAVRDLANALATDIDVLGIGRLDATAQWAKYVAELSSEIFRKGQATLTVDSLLHDDLERLWELLPLQPGAVHSDATNTVSDEAQIPALSNQKYLIIQAMLELGASSANNRRSAEEIAVKVEGRGANSNKFKTPLSELKREDYVDSKKGRGGGFWLSGKGILVAEKLS